MTQNSTTAFLIATALLALTTGCKSSSSKRLSEPIGLEGSAVAVTLADASDAGGVGAVMPGLCPMGVEGSNVEVSDTETGVALTFTTGESDVAVLRTRVRDMADMYASHGGHRGMMWHPAGRGRGQGRMGGRQGHGMMGAQPMGPGSGAGMGMGPGAGMGMGPGAGMGHGPGRGMARGLMPAATATVAEVEGGARIELVPTDAGQLEGLREHTRMHRERMHSGECPMLDPQERPENEQGR